MKKIILLTIILFLAIACDKNKETPKIKPEQHTKLKKEGKTIRFGSVSRHFLNINEQYKPLDSYIVSQLNEFGYTTSKSVLTKTVDQMRKKIINGEVDVYAGSLYSTLYLAKKAGLEPILKRAINDDYFLTTLIFVNKKSGIKTLDDLLGKVIVFEHDYSTSGYQYPKILLTKLGYNLVEVKSPEQIVDNNKIGFCFSGHDENSVAWIINGYAIAAATDRLSYRNYSGSKISDLNVIFESDKYVRFVISVNKHLSNDIKEEIIKAYIKFPQIASKIKELERYYKPIKFGKIYEEEYSSFNKILEEYIANSDIVPN